jgi:hypothetical protein
MEEEGDTLFAAYWEAHRGRALIELGRYDEGEAEVVSVLLGGETLEPDLRSLFAMAVALAAARTRPQDAARWASELRESSPVRDLPELLARGFAAAAAGDRPTAARIAAEAQLVVPQVVDYASFRLAEKLAQELEGRASAWRIACDGSWVEPPGGERTALHGANARIVLCLARRRVDEPGEAVDIEGLFEAGWPGEKILPAAAGNRVRVALSTLRRQGMAEIIERSEGGWRLLPGVVVQIV